MFFGCANPTGPPCRKLIVGEYQLGYPLHLPARHRVQEVIVRGGEDGDKGPLAAVVAAAAAKKKKMQKSPIFLKKYSCWQQRSAIFFSRESTLNSCDSLWPPPLPT